MKFTVLGGQGFIGTNLVGYLGRNGHDVFAPSRNADEIDGQHLGHVIYAIGVTSDFRSRPFDTVDAHVGVLAHLLKRCRFESWLYLSSTRVYSGLSADALAGEESQITVVPGADSLYDISKLLGEALCLALPSDTVRVARLSNVYGIGQSAETFLAAVLGEVSRSGSAVIRESPDSGKDYIALTDVLPLLEVIALQGTRRIYNVASGMQLTHAELAKNLAQVAGATVRFLPGASRRAFPRIDVSRITAEFGLRQMPLISNLSDLLLAYRTS